MLAASIVLRKLGWLAKQIILMVKKKKKKKSEPMILLFPENDFYPVCKNQRWK